MALTAQRIFISLSPTFLCSAIPKHPPSDGLRTLRLQIEDLNFADEQIEIANTKQGALSGAAAITIFFLEDESQINGTYSSSDQLIGTPTGAMQFKDDWPGFLIRGDKAGEITCAIPRLQQHCAGMKHWEFSISLQVLGEIANMIDADVFVRREKL